MLGLTLRWPQIDESLWLDELHTAWCASGSLADVSPRAFIGNQSPLYFYLPYITVRLFGANELAVRLPSLVSGLFMIPVVGLLVGKWTRSAGAAVFAAMLLAVDRHLVFYGQEARPYAVLQLLAWLHVGIVWRLAVQASLRWRAAFVFGAVLLFYIHYTAALMWAGEVVFLALAAQVQTGGRKYSLGQLLIDLLLIGAACLPAAGHIGQIASHRHAWQDVVAEPSWSNFVQIFRLADYLLGPFSALVLAAAWHRLVRRRTWRVPDRAAVALVICLVLVPAAAAWVADQAGAPLLFRRYLTPASVAVMVLAALIGSCLPARWLRVTIAMLTLSVSVWTSGIPEQYWLFGRVVGDRQQDWRGAVGFVNQHATASTDVALVRSGFLEADRLRTEHSRLLEEFCLAPVQSIYSLKIPAIPLPTSDAARLDVLPADFDLGRKRTWYIVNGSLASRTQFLTAVQEEFRRRELDFAITSLHEFGDVLVFSAAAK